MGVARWGAGGAQAGTVPPGVGVRVSRVLSHFGCVLLGLKWL